MERGGGREREREGEREGGGGSEEKGEGEGGRRKTEKNCTIVKYAYQRSDHDCLCADHSWSRKSERPFTIIYKCEP